MHGRRRRPDGRRYHRADLRLIETGLRAEEVRAVAAVDAAPQGLPANCSVCTRLAAALDEADPQHGATIEHFRQYHTLTHACAGRC